MKPRTLVLGVTLGAIGWVALVVGFLAVDAIGGWQLVAGLAFTVAVFGLLDKELRRWLRGKQ